MKYRMRMHKEMDLEVTWIHHLKKNGNSSTRTRPLRVRAVQGLSGLALLNVDPEGTITDISPKYTSHLTEAVKQAGDGQDLELLVCDHVYTNRPAPLTKSTSMRSGLM